MKRQLKQLSLLVLMACATPENMASPTDDDDLSVLSSSFSKEIRDYWLSKPDEEGRADPEWMVGLFDEHFDRYSSSTTIEHLDNNNLIHLYRATREVVFYTHDREKSMLLKAIRPGVDRPGGRILCTGIYAGWPHYRSGKLQRSD